MKRSYRSYRTATLAFCVLVVSGFVALGACSNQGEGERCESLNGNDDCKTDDGLVCYPAALLTNSASDRCCPSDRSQATNPVCKTPIAVGVDATPPADTGPGANPDTGTAATTDASDGGEATDAPSDG